MMFLIFFFLFFLLLSRFSIGILSFLVSARARHHHHWNCQNSNQHGIHPFQVFIPLFEPQLGPPPLLAKSPLSISLSLLLPLPLLFSIFLLLYLCTSFHFFSSLFISPSLSLLFFLRLSYIQFFRSIFVSSLIASTA